MIAFLRQFFNSDYMPHGHCYLWDPLILWLNAGSDVVIALAYYSIPVALFVFARRRKDLRFHWIFLMFAGFILACGTTHAIEVWNVWNGAYPLAGVVKALTATLSIGTALVLWPLLPKAMALPSPRQLEDANDALRSEIVLREKAEEELRSANATLAERNRELARVNEELRREAEERERTQERQHQLEAKLQQTQKMESLEVLAGGVAHDFNNLLMSVLGNAELAGRRAPEGDPVRDHVAKIKTAALRAGELTQQLLAYSGKGQLEVSAVNLTEVVSEMGNLLEAAISKKAKLTFELEGNIPAIEGDVTQIRQVVMNLITNASDSLGEDSGTIAVKTGLVEADATYLAASYSDEHLPEGHYAFIEVQDTGCGMDAETRQRIFDPFFTTKFKGRGLGLAATLGIVRAHRGAVMVYSEPGRGTRFKILFPCPERPPIDLDATLSRVAESWRGHGTVLVVDDEEPVREVAADLLRQLGFEVLAAASGAEGLELFRQHCDELRLVLLDLVMPEMDGAEVLREIRRQDPDARVLLTSGYHEREKIEEMLGSGAAGFLQKPFRAEMLVLRVRDALGDVG